MELRKLPIGIQSFEDLKKNQYVYVDKTEYIEKLVNSGKVFFLSRPRRFGKSLFLSTLEAYFQGKKDLFKGLDIEQYENEKGDDAWKSYPVIKFSLAGGDYLRENGLEDILKTTIKSYGSQYHVKESGETLPVQFGHLIKNISGQTGKQVVILVDEYDKPLLDTMNVNTEQEEKNRQLYSSFFSVLKDEDAYLKFVFITGVTKFAKVSIFSGLNQLRDISLSREYAGICGITQNELNTCFREEIKNMAEENEMSEEECVQELAELYDGYHFARKSEGVYNPFSLMNAFQEKEFGRYWFSTGTPTFLVRALENSDYTPEVLNDGVAVTEDILKDYRGDLNDPVPLAYQSGYLTIQKYERESGLYYLSFPNDEVEYGYLNVLAPSVLGGRETDRVVSIARMNEDLRNGKIDSFMTRLQSLFASIPYTETKELKYEEFWQREVYLVLKLLGQRTYCQPHTARGRADCVIETKKYVYILEFKMDQSVEEALKQIEEKGYAFPYKSDPRTLYKIGVKFSSEKRTIEEWKIAEQ